MSKYDDIITALQARLGLILIASGYRTDAGAKVWVNLQYQTEPPQVPCCIIFPGDVSDSLDGDTPPSQGEENHLLPVEIEGFIADDETGSAGHDLRQDILTALKVDRLFGGLTEGFSGAIESSATVYQAGQSGFRSHVQVRVTLFYVTAYGQQ